VIVAAHARLVTYSPAAPSNQSPEGSPADSRYAHTAAAMPSVAATAHATASAATHAGLSRGHAAASPPNPANSKTNHDTDARAIPASAAVLSFTTAGQTGSRVKGRRRRWRRRSRATDARWMCLHFAL